MQTKFIKSLHSLSNSYANSISSLLASDMTENELYCNASHVGELRKRRDEIRLNSYETCALLYFVDHIHYYKEYSISRRGELDNIIQTVADDYEKMLAEYDSSGTSVDLEYLNKMRSELPYNTPSNFEEGFCCYWYSIMDLRDKLNVPKSIRIFEDIKFFLVCFFMCLFIMFSATPQWKRMLIACVLSLIGAFIFDSQSQHEKLLPQDGYDFAWRWIYTMCGIVALVILLNG